MKYYFYLLLISVTFICSCKKNTNLGNSEITSERLQPMASSRPLPIGDQNLIPDWDWTQPSWTAYFNNANGSVGQITTLNPFIDGSQPIFGNTNVQKADMYPSQGWMLVARDFGTINAATAYPFIVLYNKYRGILRVCILRTYDVLSAYQQITLSYAPNIIYPDVFKYTPPVNDFFEPALQNTKTSEFKQFAVTSAGVQEWMIADFDARGYSNTIDDNLAFNISLSEIIQSDVVLNGNIALKSVQPRATYGGGLKGFTTTLDILSSVIGKAAPQAAVILQVASKLLSSLSTDKEGNSVSVNLLGTTSSKGSITMKSPKSSFSIYLKNTATGSGYKAVQPISWGVLNILAFPILSDRMDPITTWVPDPNGGPDYSEVTTGHARTVTFAPNFISKSLLINPIISNDVASVEIAYITSGDNNSSTGNTTYAVSDFLPLAQFEENANNQFHKNQFTNQIGTYNKFMAFGVKLTFSNGTIVYQVIPF